MPVPVFIICSQSAAIDRASNSLSIFNAVDKLVFAKVPPSNENRIILVEMLSLMITSVWMKSEGDEGKTFDGEFFAVLPPNNAKLELGKNTFSFTQQFYRLIAAMKGTIPFEGSGIVWIHSRIRESGGKEWVEQKYPILVEENAGQPQVSTGPKEQATSNI